MAKITSFLRVLPSFLVRQLAKWKIAVKLSGLVVSAYDEDQNAGAIDYIQIELGHAARAALVFPHDIVMYMELFPYEMFVLKPTGISPVNGPPFTKNRYSYINFLFVRTGYLIGLGDIVIPE